MFFVQHECFWFQHKQLKKHNFLVKRGVATNVFFINLCFAKCEKLSFFPPFFAQFWLMPKKHYKNTYFSTLFKATNWKKIHFEVLLSGPSRCYYLGQVDCNLKMANLAQIITPQICARNFSKKNVLKPLFL